VRILLVSGGILAVVALTINACSADAPSPAASAPAAVFTPPAPAHPCAAAAELVEPYRARAEAAWVGHVDDAATRRTLRALAKDAAATYASAAFREAFATCKALNSADPVSRGDVADLGMWNVDVSLAALDADGGDPEQAMSDLTIKLAQATTLAN
jgi:hypothetical protein